MAPSWMDVTVTDAEGLPEKAFLSVRVGEVRKQCQYKPGDSFRFDVNAAPRHIHVDVFQKVGSGTVSVADLAKGVNIGELQETLTFMRGDGNPFQLGLRVNFADPALAELAEKKARRPAPKEDALKARSYLEKHNVSKLLQEMVQSLLREQPDDPLAFMGNYLRKSEAPPQAPAHVPEMKAHPQVADAENFAKGRLSTKSIPWMAVKEADEEGFPPDGTKALPDLAGHHSILANLLRGDPALYKRLQDVRTPLGVPLARCVKPGIDCKGHVMIKAPGLVAGDAECYSVFEEVFWPVISQYHGFPENCVHMTDLDFSKVSSAPIDPRGGHVVSTQILASRNFEGLRMLPAISREERMEVERLVASACHSLQGELQGDFHALRGSSSYVPKPGGMSEKEEDQLRAEDLLFECPDSAILVASGLSRDWPEARGVFVSRDQRFAVWANEVDHMCFVSREDGAEMKRAFHRLCSAEDALRRVLWEKSGYGFARSLRFGYLTTCPSSIGTAMQASAVLRLPRLAQQLAQFRQLCRRLGLSVRIAAIANAGNGVWDVSTTKRLGCSEVQQMNALIHGCRRLVELETRLEDEEKLDLAAEIDAAESELSAAARAEKHVVPPGLGDEEYPGFPVAVCPDVMPDLEGHHSIMADVLRADPSIYERLKGRLSTAGVSFATCVKSGFDIRGHPLIKTVGAVAGDASCYDAFQEFFDPVIRRRHAGCEQFPQVHPFELDSARVTDLPLDPDGRDRVAAVRVVVSRNLANLRMPSACSIDERREVERVAVEALASMSHTLEGEYFPVSGSRSHYARSGTMPPTEEQEEFVRKGMVFEEPESEVMLSSGFGRHWPDARGLFVGNSRDFAVWVNDEDHVRAVCMDAGDNLKETFGRLCRLLQAMESGIEQAGHGFARSSRLGFLGSCPSNVGTCLAVRVTLRIPHLSEHARFRSICKTLKLQVRGRVFSDGTLEDGTWEVSNLERLGSSEAEQVNVVVAGCRTLLELDATLERGEELLEDIVAKPVTLTAVREEPPAAIVAEAVAHDTVASPPVPMLISIESFPAESQKSEASVPAPMRVAAKRAPREEDLDPLPVSEFTNRPGLGNIDYPGFPTDNCPERMPDLSKHFTLMAEVLRNNPGMYDRLRNLRSAAGVSLATCIKPGLDNNGHPMIKAVGACAGDADCYDTFTELYEGILQMQKASLPVGGAHPAETSARRLSACPMDPDGKHVVSVRLRARRNLRGLPMPPAAQRLDRREVERKLVEALQKLPEEYAGEYLPLVGSTSYHARPCMTPEEQQRLRKQGLHFNEPDAPLLLSAGTGRHWPEARGVFASTSGDFAAWINEEDHVMMILTSTDADLRQPFRRLYRAERMLRASIRAAGVDFARHSRFGHVTTCPGNLGTGLFVEVSVKLPLVSAQPRFRNTCKRLNIQVRSSALSQSHGVWDVSNAVRIGCTEADQANSVIQGVRALLAVEKRLEQGEKVDMDTVTAEPPSLDPEGPDDDSDEEFSSLPGLGDEEMPGFPADVCPEALPDLSFHSSVVAEIFRKHPEIYEKLRLVRTDFGVGLAKCIKPAMDNRGHPMIRMIGAVAGDATCYKVFEGLFGPMLRQRTIRRSVSLGGTLTPLASGTVGGRLPKVDRAAVATEPIDTSAGHVVSMCLAASRNLNKFRFPAAISREERRDVERIVVGALNGLSGEFKGEYFPLEGSDSYEAMPEGMEPEKEAELELQGLLFREPDSGVKLSSGLGRHWPEARGVFVNAASTMGVWVNEEDHLRIHLDTGRGWNGRFDEAYEHLSSMDQTVKEALRQQGQEYAHDEGLGFLTTDPSNVGDGGFRASLKMRLPLLAAHSEFSTLCREIGVKARIATSTDGDQLLTVYGIVQPRPSSIEQVNLLAFAGKRLVEMEMGLARGVEPRW